MIFSRWLASLLRPGGMGRARGEEVCLFFLFFFSFLMLSFLSLLSIAFRFRCMAKVSISFFNITMIIMDLSFDLLAGGGRNNCCRICGQVTQNRKRLLKHYCTRHFIDRLGALEYSFIVRNKCVECGRDFVGAKKSSKVGILYFKDVSTKVLP